MPSLIATTVAGFSGYTVLLSTAPLWAARGGADPGGAGLVNAVMLLTTVVAQFFVPAALTRFGHAAVLSTGLCFLGVPALGYGLSDALGPILVMSALRGVGFAVLTVAGSAITARLVPAHQLGSAVGAYGLAIAAPMAVLLPLSVPVFENAGPWATFLLGTVPVLGVPAAIALGRKVDEIAAAASRDLATTPRGMSWELVRHLARPTAILLSVTLVGGALITFLPQHVGSSGTVALALMLLTIAAAVGRWGVGTLADRFGARRFLLPLLLSTALAMGAVAWWVQQDDGGTPAAWGLLVAVGVVGLGYGALQNLTLVVAFQAVGSGRINQASAGWNMGFDGGTALGSLLTGFIAGGASFAVAYAILAVATLAATAAVRST